MKKTTYLLLTSLCLLVFNQLFADPPTPPAGYKWERVWNLSDEFNQGSLDASKWMNYNENWAGRDPGRFKPAQVSVSNGNLILRNKKVAATNQTVWVHTGFCRSKNSFVAGMYSECKMKVAKDGTVTGFWMSPTSGGMTEIDVQEGVGWPPNGNWNLTKQMRMNTHYHATNWSWDYNTPGDHNIGKNVGDSYHTYGVWWKDKRNITMYYGGGNGVATKYYTKGDFTQKMRINMNTETQNWLGDPNVSYLANNSRNATYVDYVRTWKLVPDNSGNNNNDNNSGTTGQKISLKCSGNSKYISSENGAVNGMNCNRSNVGGWEKFTIEEIGSGYYALKGSNGKYVSSENGAKKMTCIRTSIGSWEKFKLEHKGNQVYALKGNNGKYVGSDMWCNNSWISNNEKFLISWGLKTASLLDEELDEDSEISFFPNPATDFITIKGLIDGIYSVKILTIQGQIVFNKELNSGALSSQLNVSDLPKGIYILKIENATTNKVLRFIKK